MSTDLTVWMDDPVFLRSYLLNELTDEKRDAVEQRLLADDDFFELVEAVEGDLLVDCANGSLSPQEHARVMRGLASSPRGRARLTTSRELAIVTRERRIAPARLIPFPAQLPPTRRPAVRFAAMAAMLVAVAGGVLLSRHTVIPGGGAAMAGNRTAGALHRLQAPAAMRDLAPAVLELALATVRSPEAQRPTLIVPAGTRSIEIRLPIEEGDDFPSYRATILDAGDETVWQTDLVSHPAGDAGTVVLVSLPADRLPAGTYRLNLNGVSPDGELEALGKSPFDIRTP